MKMGSDSINIAINNGIFNFSMGIKAIIGFISYILSFLIYTFYIIRKFDLSFETQLSTYAVSFKERLTFIIPSSLKNLFISPIIIGTA